MSSGVISLSVDEEETPKKSAEEERQLSEFAKVLAEKYGVVFDEPIPERLADLIRRLREIRSDEDL